MEILHGAWLMYTGGVADFGRLYDVKYSVKSWSVEQVSNVIRISGPKHSILGLGRIYCRMVYERSRGYMKSLGGISRVYVSLGRVYNLFS